jgi:hypothetical protein
VTLPRWSSTNGEADWTGATERPFAPNAAFWAGSFATRTLPDVARILTARDFAYDAHQRVYSALCALADGGLPIELVALTTS